MEGMTATIVHTFPGCVSNLIYNNEVTIMRYIISIQSYSSVQARPSTDKYFIADLECLVTALQRIPCLRQHLLDPSSPAPESGRGPQSPRFAVAMPSLTLPATPTSS